MATDPLIRVSDLRKRFGPTPVLEGITFDVGRGEIFVIMGPSGSGKTVLLKQIVGLLRPDSGEIYMWDQPVHALDEDGLDALRRRIGVVFQSAALFDSLTVYENVAFPLRRHKRLPEEHVRSVVREKLALVDLEEAERLMPAELSGGMRKRVGIARALALEPEVIFYDEPTSGLDPMISRTVDDLIRRLRDHLGTTSVVVTHDLDTAFGIGTRVAMLWEGRLLAIGVPEEILRDPRPEVQAFIARGLAGVTGPSHERAAPVREAARARS